MLHTAYQSKAMRGREIEHKQSHNSNNIIIAKQPALSLSKRDDCKTRKDTNISTDITKLRKPWRDIFTYYLSLITYYLLLITYYLLLITYHLLLITYYLLLITYCLLLITYHITGPRSAVSNVSGNRCESDCRSRGRKFDPGPVPYFRGD